MFDMVRWLLDLGWPKQIASSGGIFMDKESKANITDTQTATFVGQLHPGQHGVRTRPNADLGRRERSSRG